MNLVNNAVATYGLKPVLGVAVVVGILSYPIIELITQKGLQILKDCFKWCVDTTFLIRIRSMGCDQCARHHRVHITTMDIIHRNHERTPVR